MFLIAVLSCLDIFNYTPLMCKAFFPLKLHLYHLNYICFSFIVTELDVLFFFFFKSFVTVIITGFVKFT